MKTLNTTERRGYGYPSVFIFLVLLAISLLTQSCGPDVDELKTPEANFVSGISRDNYLMVSFSNLSKDAKKYVWDFGDGNQSTEDNPTHIYELEGTYDVTLTAYNGEKEHNTTTALTIVNPENFPEGRYLNTVFTDIDFSEGSYGSFSVNNYKFFEPVGDTHQKRPMIILSPGGNFLEFTRVDALVGMARDLAKRGYVTAVIEYAQAGNDVTGTLQDYMDLFILGMRDQRSAVRFFRQNATAFGIDPNRIYLGGWSTGASLSFATTYITEDNINSFTDTRISSGLQSAMDKFGGLDNSDNIGVSSEVYGAMIIMGYSLDASLMSADVPLMLINHEKAVTVEDCQSYVGEVNAYLADDVTVTIHGTDIIYQAAQNAGLTAGVNLEYIVMDEWQNDWVECDWYPNVSTLTSDNYPAIAEFFYNNF